MKKRFISLLLVSIMVVSMVAGLFSSSVYATDLNKLTGETPSGIPFTEMEEEIDQYVSRYIGQTTPGAAVAVVKDGEIIFLKGYGYADIENQIPVDPKNTVFEWASTSKLFTWTSVMQLVEQGKLDLDADIKTYLPLEFAQKLEYTQAITMRDIMNHAAGFGDYAFNTIVFSKDKLVSLEEAILRDKPKQYYEVGTASAYSNYTASLAGYVVQSISKQPFQNYEREHIFNVLSMNNTSAHPTFDDNKEILDNKAKGYLPDQKGGFTLGNWSYVSHLPAGSINGTVEDMARYAIALTPNEGELSPLFNSTDTLKAMLSPSYDLTGEMVGTAHGFFEYVGEYRTLGHGGNTAAFSSQFAIVPKERFGIVILTNAYLEMDILFGLQDLLLGKEDMEIKVPDREMPSSSKVVGQYVPMERQEGNFVDFAKYIGLYRINAIDKNKITMSLGSYQGTYIQTKPYYYELIDDNIPFFRNAYPILRFKMEDDTVKQIVVGHGMDLSALPQGRTIPILITSLIVLIITSLFFFIAPILLLIIAIRNRKKQLAPENKRFILYHSLLILFASVTIVNNLIPSTKIMINNFRTFAEFKPHILLNYPLLLGTIIVGMFSVSSIRKAVVSKKRKVIYAITLILLVLLFTLLIHWNYFAIVG